MNIKPYTKTHTLEELFTDTVALDQTVSNNDGYLNELVPNFVGKTPGYYAEVTSEELESVIDASNRATELLYKALDHFMSDASDDNFRTIGIEDRTLIDIIRQSYDMDDHCGMIHRFMPNVVNGLYGNYDATIDDNGKVWFYEFNGNTPVLTYESIAIQDMALRHIDPEASQFNELFERWVDFFEAMYREFGELKMVFGGFSNLVNDLLTVDTMCNAAMQAGHSASIVDIRYDIEIDHINNMLYVYGEDKPIDYMFNLFPWEDYDTESLITFKKNYQNLKENGKGTIIVEPPYKLVMSNKAFLAYVWEHFPEEAEDAGIIPTYLDETKLTATQHVRKPVYGRMSANISVVEEGDVLDETDGDFGDNLMVYQPFIPLIEKPEGNFQLRMWISPSVENDYEFVPCGLAVRKSNSKYNMNVESEEFIPHVII